MPKVSIIIPVYNVEDYLIKCIDSVLNQTLKDFELILVNDGSTDDSLAICKKYQLVDKRIILLDQANQGSSVARNNGLNIARGQYISFIDSDDYIDENFLKDNIEILDSENADMILFGYFEISRKTYNEKLYSNSQSTKDIIEGLFTRKIAPAPWNKIYKREIFENLRFKEGIRHQDFYILPFVVDKCRKIVYNNKAYYYYNTLNKKSVTNTIKRAESNYIQFLSLINFIEIAKKNNWTKLCSYDFELLIKQAIKLYNYYKKEDEKKNSYIKEVVKGYSKETWLKNGLSIRYKVLLWDYLHMNIFAYWYKNK